MGSFGEQNPLYISILRHKLASFGNSVPSPQGGESPAPYQTTKSRKSAPGLFRPNELFGLPRK
jgi:hypothetical protein